MFIFTISRAKSKLVLLLTIAVLGLIIFYLVPNIYQNLATAGNFANYSQEEQQNLGEPIRVLQPIDSQELQRNNTEEFKKIFTNQLTDLPINVD